MMSPVGLDEDAIDLFEVYFFDLIADRFQEGGKAKISDATQDSFRGTDDEGQGFV